jgi:hypothetical protein
MGHRIYDVEGLTASSTIRDVLKQLHLHTIPSSVHINCSTEIMTTHYATISDLLSITLNDLIHRQITVNLMVDEEKAELPEVVEVPKLPEVVEVPKLPEVVEVPKLPEVVEVPKDVEVPELPKPKLLEHFEFSILASLPTRPLIELRDIDEVGLFRYLVGKIWKMTDNTQVRLNYDYYLQYSNAFLKGSKYDNIIRYLERFAYLHNPDKSEDLDRIFLLKQVFNKHNFKWKDDAFEYYKEWSKTFVYYGEGKCNRYKKMTEFVKQNGRLFSL